MNSIEEYQNLVELLKRALAFYANKENYLFYTNKDAPIALDEGSQARFALEKIKDVTEASDKMEADYIKNLSEAIVSEEDTEKSFGKLIEEIKKIGDGNNNV